MNITATCTNPACSELDLPKHGDVPLTENELVVCGECGEPCRVVNR